MKLKKILICGILISIISGICACSGQAENKGENAPEISSEAETGGQEEAPQRDGASDAEGEDASAQTDDASREGVADETHQSSDTGENGTAEGTLDDAICGLPLARSREEEGIDFVGINAHIKEIHGGTLLISSDSDDYPGVFTVEGADEMPEFANLQEGGSIQILMQKLAETDGQGLAKYRAERLGIVSEDEEEAHADILLTDVPTLTLQDALSSTMNVTEVRPGNYNWNVVDGEEGTSGIACGPPPLEEAAMDFTVRLKVPEYNGTGGVPYVFSTTIAPDSLLICQWNAEDIGNTEAKAEKVTKYYYKTPILELEAGKVYDFAMEWKKENAGKNKFYGNAGYVLVTE